MTANPAGRTGLAAALAAFQAEIPAIPKGETANAGTYTYDYAGLDTVTAKVLPLLGKHGLAFTCWPTLSAEGKFILAYRLCHGPSDEHMDGEYPLPDKGRPQDIGSAISYGRRYCLTAVTGVAPGGEDNDAADVPEHVMDKPRRVAYTGADHERLAHQSPDELANHRGPAERVRGQVAADEWETAKPAPARGSAAEEAVTRQAAAQQRHDELAEAVRGQLPEDQPGSITEPQLRRLHAMLNPFFSKQERDNRYDVFAAGKIIGRDLDGPAQDYPSLANLSYVEADQLKNELKGLTKEGLVAALAATAGATS